MQNTDANDNITDTNKNLEPWPSQPISLEILPTLPEAGSNQELEGIDKNSRIIHSDPEESQAKAKSRSRFSSAIRKLSRSTRKKNKTVGLIKSPSPDASSPTSTEPILSSDADELPTDRQVITKKKKKSIFSLKKSKVAPQKDSLDSLPPQTAKVLEPLFQDTQNEVLVTTERLSPSSEGKRKVQITIKSKKIEKVASTGKSNDSHPSPKSEKDQPSSTTTTPTSTPPQVRQSATITTTTTKTTSTTAASAAVSDSEDKKKLKWKTKSSSKSSATAPQAKKSEGEKIIITQSSKDTPPKDKAPAKPSRLAASQHPTTNASHSTNTSSSSSTSTSTPANTSKTSGAIRKTATTTRAAIKLVTAAKTKAKSPAREAKKAPTTKAGKGSTTTTATVTKSSSPITTAVAATETTVKEESDLMINPQRGYRYPRPTSTEPADKSHETLGARQPTPSPPPSLTLTASLPASTHSNKDLSASTATQPQTSEIQSGLQSVTSNASLATSAISHHHQQQQHKSSQDNLVHISPANQADDHISLAESVQPSRTSAEDLVTARKPPPLQDTFNTSFGQFAFDLGDRVRPPPLVPKQLGYEPSSQDPYSVEHHSDDDSDTDTEDDHNRRRIPYISAAPSLYDEFNSLELRRAHFRNQSGVSDLSLDSHKEDISSFDDLNQMPAFGDLTMDQEMEPTIMTSTNAEKREHLYKILVIGELGTGKTSFIKRYVHQFFSQNYRATIGVDFALKVLHWDPNTIVRLQLWDIAGQERFGNMTRVYYKEAVGAFIVFDVTRSGTFDCVSKWKEDLDSKVQLPDGSPIPCILLANKCDQDKQGVVTNAEKMDEYVKEHGFAGWFETSAKENINIDEAARALVNKILLNDKLISASDLADSEKFNLNNSGDQTMNEDKSKCAC
ncbi:RAS oncogene family member Rab32 isoform X1 [Haematobia irritans]|uniref:RAS oncogene family member Rab32 isoform X1 n=2 Tax=Haematobia irritans TaxID=7368 RepID=UPI003F4F8329